MLLLVGFNGHAQAHKKEPKRSFASIEASVEHGLPTASRPGRPFREELERLPLWYLQAGRQAIVPR